ncbi:MAG: AAA-like domain-containing protein [Acidobacteria bacterium]|nr:AAA-like domain-containing protein [Acidobacteriota bacterium]
MRIPLQQQPFHSLICLLEHPGEIVTREELRARVWPDRVHVEFEANLNRVMNKLRSALGDSAGRSRYIETIPGRGYRFIAPAEGAPHPGPSLTGKGGPHRLPVIPISGAISIDSPFYIEREADSRIRQAIAGAESVLLIKGPRQSGKTSLLARVIHHARFSGMAVISVDLQKLNAPHLSSMETFLQALTKWACDASGVSFEPRREWDAALGASMNFDRIIKSTLLRDRSRHLVWAIDEADRLFACPFGNEFFALLRSWQNERAVSPEDCCRRLTVAVACASDSLALLNESNQFPLSAGTSFVLENFSRKESAELNRRYDSPLAGTELAELHDLVGGHPFLTQAALFETAVRRRSWKDVAANASNTDGPFGEHLRHVAAILERNPTLQSAITGILNGKSAVPPSVFYRLRSIGLVDGNSPRKAHPRCQLYRHYLRKCFD